MGQIYENYWGLTLEYSDFNDKFFNTCLQIIIDFIDNNDMHKLDKKLYGKLQKQIYDFNPKSDYASVRKSINQFLKLGFINNHLQSYHPKTKEFLGSADKETKRRIYSEILYDNASFNRSVTHPSNVNEINFLIKTLEHCKSITQDNLMALMTCDVSQAEFIENAELDKLTHKIFNISFDKRKYNQRNFLWNICKEILVGIYIDTNGDSGPNVIGKDIYVLTYTSENGILPAGFHKTVEEIDNNCSEKAKGETSGLFCLLRTKNNGWTIPDDVWKLK